MIRWFGSYAEHFATVEINKGFYMLPKPETFDKWREQAQSGSMPSRRTTTFSAMQTRMR